MRRCPISPLLLLAGALVLAVPVPAWAQSSPETDVLAEALAPPVYAAHVDGPVTVTRDGASLVLDLNAPLLDGDRVRTAPTSRLGTRDPGMGTRLPRPTLHARSARADRLRLVDGRARLDLNDAAGEALRVDTPAAGILPTESRQLSVEVVIGDSGDEVTLTVLEGSAEFQTDRGALTVRAGESARARGMGHPSWGVRRQPQAERRVRRVRGSAPCRVPRVAPDPPERLPDETGRRTRRR